MGFWVHRLLEANAIERHVDAAPIVEALERQATRPNPREGSLRPTKIFWFLWELEREHPRSANGRWWDSKARSLSTAWLRPTNCPNLPHLDPEKIGNFAEAKIKEAVLAATGG
jgi:hypothetical protein